MSIVNHYLNQERTKLEKLLDEESLVAERLRSQMESEELEVKGMESQLLDIKE
jgi:hypothetical protein